MPEIVHVIPDSVGNTSKVFLGSTKDVACRTEYFRVRGLSVLEYKCKRWSDVDALEMLKSIDLSCCKFVVFEYETFIESLLYLKEKFPHIKRIIRAHNSNLPHYIDYYRGGLRMRIERPGLVSFDPMDDMKSALHRFKIDFQCAHAADYILSICDWEAENYWKAFGGNANVVNVPYYIPEPFSCRVARCGKTNLFVCFMGTGGVLTPVLYDAARNTSDLIEALPDAVARQWLFCITGVIKPFNILGKINRLIPTGRLDSPMPILGEARVVSILSDLGMGFKTKILEAAECGCWVLVTHDVYSRLPELVKPFCIPVAANDSVALQNALRLAQEPIPSFSPNVALKNLAYRNLDSIFLPAGADFSAPVKLSEPSSTPTSLAAPTCDTGDYPSYLKLMVDESRKKWNALVLPLVKARFAQQGEVRLVDYGVGIGESLQVAHGAGCICRGVGRSQYRIDLARRFAPSVDLLSLIQPDGTIVIESDWADIVYSFDEFFYITRRSFLRKTIDEVARILRKGGVFRFFYRTWPLEDITRFTKLCHWCWTGERASHTFRFKTMRHVSPALVFLPSLRFESFQNDLVGHLTLPLWQLTSYLRKAGFARIDVDRSKTKPPGYWITAYL